MIVACAVVPWPMSTLGASKPTNTVDTGTAPTSTVVLAFPVAGDGPDAVTLTGTFVLAVRYGMWKLTNAVSVDEALNVCELGDTEQLAKVPHDGV